MSFNKKDFEIFNSATSLSEESFPKLNQSVIEKIISDLNPSPYFIFLKVLSVHCVSAIVTLAICPQFGIRFFGEGPGLMGYFMRFGEAGCLVACGSVFIGFSMLMSGLFLTTLELLTLKRTRFLQFMALISFSLGTLIMLDADLIFESILLAWVLGCFVGGLSMLEFAIYFKVRRTTLT